MSFEIKNDVGTMLLQNTFASAQKQFMSSMVKLSTGLSINQASDNAANLAISEKLNSQMREQETLSRISQMESAMTKVAESDLAAIGDNVQRMRDLSLQAANGTYSASERSMIQDEISMLNDEINRIAASSEFNDKKLLDGSASGTEFMAAEPGGPLVAGSAFDDASAASLGVGSVNVSTQADALALVDRLDTALENVSSRRSELGSIQNVLDSNVERNEIAKENIASSYSTIRDTDIAKEMSNLVNSEILMQSSIAMQAQANSASDAVYGLLKP